MTDAEDPDLIELVCRAMELRERGEEPDLAALCQARPELLPQLTDAVVRADRLSELSLQAAPRDPLEGTLISERYRVLSRLGAGSMGVVYQGVDEELNRSVAVKVMRQGGASPGTAEARFLREAEALAAIRHPAVVSVHDRGRTSDGALYLVMDLLTGAPLVDVIHEAARRGEPGEQDPLGWLADEFGAGFTSESSYLRTVVTWMADLAAGLGAAHARGIYHRDVKPSNVFVQSDGTPVLVDFGIAALESHETLTQGTTVGTPAYMAPELLDGKTARGPGPDVWGLCATLYHALTLQPPYQGLPAQVLAALARRDPTPAYRIHPRLPKDLQAIIDRGLARRPGERYPDAGALEADLRAFLEHRPVSARYVSPALRRARSVGRSPAVRSALAVVALFLLFLYGSARSTARARERDEQGMELWTRMPPALTLWSPRNRFVDDEGERASIQELLDSAIELRSDPTQARLIRAAFALDHGRAEDAARDMLALAARIDTPYLHELAERHVGVDAERALAEGVFALELEELPEPQTAVDEYVQAYLLLRKARSIADLEAIQGRLETPSLSSSDPATELLLLVLVSLIPHGETRAERFARARQALGLAMRFEERCGRRSALTAHVIGGALLGQERHEEALAVIQEGLELAPSFHGLHSNLGIAARRLGDYERAQEALHAAIALKPEALNSYLTLARLIARLEAYDEALEVAAGAPFEDSDEGRRDRALLEGDIENGRAVSLWRQGEHEAAKRAALAALEHYGRAESLGSKRDSSGKVISREIVKGRPHEAFNPLMDRLLREPTNWQQLQAVHAMMPKELSPDEVEMLRQYMAKIAEHLDP